MSADALSRLQHLERLAHEIGAAGVADEAHSLAQRAAEGRFYVACVGQFKRGKSTLLNALVGDRILPTGTVPVTSVVTILRHGDRAMIRLRQSGMPWLEIAREDLPDYVSEERNPGNAKGVLAVEVFLPSPLLASGLCFVDTPGLGSVFEANSEATREFVPHIDAALAVFGADPPISGEETALILEIARQVETFVFVMNKADRVSDEECEEAAAFAERVLSQKLGRPVERVFRVSALERLTTGQATRDWSALMEHLRTLAEESGEVLVESAIHRGLHRLAARLRNILAEEEAALRRPLEETARRLTLLKDAQEEASRALWEIGPLFDAELQRLGSQFARRRTEFLQQAIPQAEKELIQTVRDSRIRFGPALRAYAFGEAQRTARQRVTPWLGQSERVAAEAYRHVTERFTDMVNDLLQRLRSSENWTSVPLPEQVGGDAATRRGRRFTFADFHNVASPAGLVPLLQWFIEAILPVSLTMGAIQRDAAAFLRRLLEVNAIRVENSVKQRLQDSRMALESEIRYVLKEVLEAAQRGMERARALQAEGESAVSAALADLGAKRAALEAEDGAT